MYTGTSALRAGNSLKVTLQAPTPTHRAVEERPLTRVQILILLGVPQASQFSKRLGSGSCTRRLSCPHPSPPHPNSGGLEAHLELSSSQEATDEMLASEPLLPHTGMPGGLARSCNLPSTVRGLSTCVRGPGLSLACTPAPGSTSQYWRREGMWPRHSEVGYSQWEEGPGGGSWSRDEPDVTHILSSSHSS